MPCRRAGGAPGRISDRTKSGLYTTQPILEMMMMSKRKNLKWICRRCVAEQKGLEIEKDTELEKRCSFCGTMTWCFLVASSRLVKSKPPSKMPAEEELTEEIEAIEEVAETALEEILEVIEREEESPEETAPAEGLEPIEEEVAAESPGPEAEIDEKTDSETEKEGGNEPTPELSEKDAKTAEIARLEAELKELQK